MVDSFQLFHLFQGQDVAAFSYGEITEDTVAVGFGLPRRMRAWVLERDGYACRYCGASGPDVVLEVDHITPRRRDGKTTPRNLATACRPCNRRKGGKYTKE